MKKWMLIVIGVFFVSNSVIYAARDERKRQWLEELEQAINKNNPNERIEIERFVKLPPLFVVSGCFPFYDAKLYKNFEKFCIENDCIGRLIDAGANIGLEINRRSALRIAVENLNVYAVKRLLQAGARDVEGSDFIKPSDVIPKLREEVEMPANELDIVAFEAQFHTAPFKQEERSKRVKEIKALFENARLRQERALVLMCLTHPRLGENSLARVLPRPVLRHLCEEYLL